MKHLVDFSLYLITKEVDTASLDHIIRQAIEGGVTIVQLRAKEAPTRQFVEISKRLLRFLRPLNIPLIINDRVDVAYASDADGVHLGQSDLAVSDARAILGRKAIIGLSVETFEQAQAAKHEDIDYVAASPIFLTQTKLDCAKPWGLIDLKQLCALSICPVIAIGGINHTNVEAVWQCGVHGVAVVSAIFDSKNPKLATQELLIKIKNSPYALRAAFGLKQKSPGLNHRKEGHIE